MAHLPYFQGSGDGITAAPELLRENFQFQNNHPIPPYAPTCRKLCGLMYPSLVS